MPLRHLHRVSESRLLSGTRGARPGGWPAFARTAARSSPLGCAAAAVAAPSRNAPAHRPVGKGETTVAQGRDPTWAPDGSRIAYVGVDGLIHTIKPAGKVTWWLVAQLPKDSFRSSTGGLGSKRTRIRPETPPLPEEAPRRSSPAPSSLGCSGDVERASP